MSTSLTNNFGGVPRQVTSAPFGMTFASRPNAMQQHAGFYPAVDHQQQSRAFQPFFMVPQQQTQVFQQQAHCVSLPGSALPSHFSRGADMQPPPKMDRRRLLEALQNGNQTPPAVEQYGENDDDDTKTGRWTSREHELFLTGYEKFGKDWKKISEFMGTRSNVQCRTHAQKFFKKRFVSEQKFDNTSDSESDNGSHGQGKRQRMTPEKVSIDPTPVQLKTKPSPASTSNIRTLTDKPVPMPLRTLVQASEQAMPLASRFSNVQNSILQLPKPHSLPYPGLLGLHRLPSSSTIGSIPTMNLPSLPYVQAPSMFKIPMAPLNSHLFPPSNVSGLINSSHPVLPQLVSAPK